MALIGPAAGEIGRGARVSILLAVDQVQEGSENRAGSAATASERTAARIVALEQRLAAPFILDDGIVELVTTEGGAAGAKR
ncbi:MAG TPA: hypothetical protein VE914_20200, partial [Candidatus Angelobacter sp.]|nr:hypothetical protein [Candidatus Angelobacter sp.]